MTEPIRIVVNPPASNTVVRTVEESSVINVVTGGGGGGGGVTDHGALTGLSDDDHTQYLNEARGDARYAQTNDTRLSDERVPTDGSVTDAKVATNADISLDKTVDGTRQAVSAAEKTKLAGIEAGATANSTDAQLRDRSTHTGTQPANTISDSTTVGRSVLTAADAAAARSAIGAGTSNLALGTTSSTAAAGDAVVRLTGDQTVAGTKTFSSAPAVPDSSFSIAKTNGLQAALDGKASSSHTHAASDISSGTLSIERLPANSTLTVHKDGGTWPARPTSRTDIVVQWVGPEPSPSIVSSGTGGMLDNKDIRMVTE